MRVPEKVIKKKTGHEDEKGDTGDRFFFLPLISKKCLKNFGENEEKEANKNQTTNNPQLGEDQHKDIMYWLDIPDGNFGVALHHGHSIIPRPNT